MEFLKERVYTALNADELKVGSKIIVANTIGNLSELVEQNMAELSDLTRIDNVYSDKRFIVNEDTDRINAFAFAYLVSEPEEKKLKWTDLKLGDVIRRKDGSREGLVTIIDKDENTTMHIHVGTPWISDKDLEDWEKVEDYWETVNEKD